MTDLRLAALRRFAIAISVLTCLGHAVLGFEQSYAHVGVALATAYGVELLLEAIDAWACRRAPAFRGGLGRLVSFLLPAPITALAATGVASKSVLRARIGGAVRHFMNPSNAGIATTLLVFPWVGVAMPYQFTENLHGSPDWLLPLVFVGVGSFLNARFTRRIPLIAAWLGGFVLQAAVRGALVGVRFVPALAPMTGVAFVRIRGRRRRARAIRCGSAPAWRRRTARCRCSTSCTACSSRSRRSACCAA